MRAPDRDAQIPLERLEAAFDPEEKQAKKLLRQKLIYPVSVPAYTADGREISVQLYAHDTFIDSAGSYARRIYVPASLQQEAIHVHHVNRLEGNHSGRDKTAAKVRLVFWFPNLYTMVTNFVNRCARCRAVKFLQPLPTLPYKTLPRWPLQFLQIDFVGPITPASTCKFTGRNCRYVITSIDEYARWPTFSPMENNTAEAVAHFLLNEVVFAYGAPLVIRSDNGPEFVAKVVRLLAEQLGVDWVSGAAYNARSQALTEQSHVGLNKTLRIYLSHDLPRLAPSWHLAVKVAQWCARTTPLSVLGGISPFEFLFGWAPRSQFSALRLDQLTLRGVEGFWKTRLQQMQKSFAVLEKKLFEDASATQETAATTTTISPGTSVFLTNEAPKVSTTAPVSLRLQPLVTGPWKVVQDYGSALLLTDGERSVKANRRRILPIGQ
eukprot:g15287.t1